MRDALVLDRARRRRIEKMSKKTRDARVLVRCRIAVLASRGVSCAAAARELGCHPSAAWRIVERFRLHGEAALLDGRCDNGERKVDADIRARIWEVLSKSPPANGWERPTPTLELLCRVIEQELRVELSVSYLWKILKAFRVRWGMARPVVGCPWKDARRRGRIGFLRRLARRPGRGEVLLSVDAVDIHLNPKIGRDWMLPGTQRIVVTPGKNEKRFLAGAYDPVHGRLVYTAGERKASWLFLNLLRALLDAYRWARTIHLILDNYTIHKSWLVRAWLAAQGARFRLHFLPPYCPEENRIERLWRDLQGSVTRNHQCRTMADLMERVHRYLAGRFHLARVLAYKERRSWCPMTPGSGSLEVTLRTGRPLGRSSDSAATKASGN